MPGGGACRRDGFRDSEPAKRIHRVREQGDAGPDGIEPRRALDRHHVMPVAAQGDRRAQPTDAGTDDDRPQAMLRVVFRLRMSALVQGFGSDYVRAVRHQVVLFG